MKTLFVWVAYLLALGAALTFLVLACMQVTWVWAAYIGGFVACGLAVKLLQPWVERR